MSRRNYRINTIDFSVRKWEEVGRASCHICTCENMLCFLPVRKGRDGSIDGFFFLVWEPEICIVKVYLHLNFNLACYTVSIFLKAFPLFPCNANSMAWGCGNRPSLVCSLGGPELLSTIYWALQGRYLDVYFIRIVLWGGYCSHLTGEETKVREVKDMTHK